MSIRLIVAPFHLGRRGEGVGDGPIALLDAGAAAALGHGGAEVGVEIVAPAGDDLFASVAAVTPIVAAAVARDELPVVLAGDCTTTAGILAGLAEPTSVLWLDAHGDFNTPETSVSGFLDGMALSALVGDCLEHELSAVPGFRPLPAGRVTLAGTRELDPPERERLEHSAIHHVSADEPLPDPGDGPIHLHLDLDVLHSSVGRVNEHPSAPGGVTAAALLGLISGMRAPLRSVAITAYNPSFDGGAVAAVALEVLDRIGRRLATTAGRPGR